MTEKRGKFIVLEGPEGCGKGEQTEPLRQSFKNSGLQILAREFSREPGSTPEGEAIRRILLHSDFDLRATTEMMLYFAARDAFLYKNVYPALENGMNVVADRFYESSYAYQVHAGGASEHLFRRLRGDIVSRDADLTFIIDIPAELGLELAGKKAALDRMESKGLEFHKKVNEGYRKFYEAYGDVGLHMINFMDYFDRENPKRGIARMHQKIVEVVNLRLGLDLKPAL